MKDDDAILNGTVKVSIRMTPQMKKYFSNLARESGMTMSEFIRNVLVWFMMGVLTHQIEVPRVVSEFRKKYPPEKYLKTRK